MNSSWHNCLLITGVERRGDDIRAATSMKIKDRSPKLPSPTFVTDNPSRPIVSFHSDWKQKEVQLKGIQSPQTPQTPSPNPTTVNPRDSMSSPLHQISSTPTVPSITVCDSPSISISDFPLPPIPFISLPSEDDATASQEQQAMPTVSISSNPSVPLPTIELQEDPSVPVPTISVWSEPPTGLPIINLPMDSPVPLPVINLPEDPPVPSTSLPGRPLIPTINMFSDPQPTNDAARPSSRDKAFHKPFQRTSRPLPKPSTSPVRPLPRHSATAPASSPIHYTPSTRSTGALCSLCALPISGRILSAAGSRFHPQCFVCHHCGEGLECVAFYPEPDAKRLERIDRIHRRLNGEVIEGEEAEEERRKNEMEDGDEGMRFYCHLDFHEFFSPRCGSCKTPIEGEVVVACGKEWHVGHFFCAQCGDVGLSFFFGPSSLEAWHHFRILWVGCADLTGDSPLTPQRPSWKRMVTPGVSTAIRIAIRQSARSAGDRLRIRSSKLWAWSGMASAFVAW